MSYEDNQWLVDRIYSGGGICFVDALEVQDYLEFKELPRSVDITLPIDNEKLWHFERFDNDQQYAAYLKALKEKKYLPNTVFESEKDMMAWASSKEFIQHCINLYKDKIPSRWTFAIKQSDGKYTAKVWSFIPAKAGIALDWVFYAGLKEITTEDILNERNVEKRYLLMAEYGLSEFIKNHKVINEDAYGILMDVKFEHDPGTIQKVCKVKNGSIEPPNTREFLRSRSMLSEDGKKYYYIFIPNNLNIKTAREAVAWSWNRPVKWFPKEGFNFET